MTAVGLFGAGRTYGMLGLLLATVLLATFALITVWGISDELGVRSSRIVPIGLVATLCVLVLLGLSELFGAYGMLIATITGLGSPPALGLLGRGLRRTRRRGQAPPVSRVSLDPATLERRFEDIVRRFEESG